MECNEAQLSTASATYLYLLLRQLHLVHRPDRGLCLRQLHLVLLLRRLELRLEPRQLLLFLGRVNPCTTEKYPRFLRLRWCSIRINARNK